MRLKKSNVRYALYPVWLLNTSWRGKQYTFAMNGQTGKFVGNLPVNKVSATIWFIIFTAIFGVVAYFVATIVNSLGFMQDWWL